MRVYVGIELTITDTFRPVPRTSTPNHTEVHHSGSDALSGCRPRLRPLKLELPVVGRGIPNALVCALEPDRHRWSQLLAPRHDAA